MKFALLSAAAIAALTMTAGAASAKTVTSQLGQFGPLPVTDGATSYATRTPGVFNGIVDNNSASKTKTMFIDDYTFTLGLTPQEIASGSTATSFDTSLSGDFYDKESGSNISSFQIFLYSGAPGSGSVVDQTDLKDLSKAGTYHYSLEDMLTAGDNYYLQADVTVPKGDMGKYGLTAITAPVSAVPEPSTWVLMMGGIGMLGFALRRSRQQQGLAFGVA